MTPWTQESALIQLRASEPREGSEICKNRKKVDQLTVDRTVLTDEVVGEATNPTPLESYKVQSFGLFLHENQHFEKLLFAPTARSRHSAFHDGRLAEKFVDLKKL